jgi:predicted site-specific integrase-resolvase
MSDDAGGMTGNEPEFFTPEQLSVKFQLARKTIKKWTLARRIPGQIKFGGRWRYSRIAVEKAILRGEFLNPQERH